MTLPIITRADVALTQLATHICLCIFQSHQLSRKRERGKEDAKKQNKSPCTLLVVVFCPSPLYPTKYWFFIRLRFIFSSTVSLPCLASDSFSLSLSLSLSLGFFREAKEIKRRGTVSARVSTSIQKAYFSSNTSSSKYFHWWSKQSKLDTLS